VRNGLSLAAGEYDFGETGGDDKRRTEGRVNLPDASVDCSFACAFHVLNYFALPVSGVPRNRGLIKSGIFNLLSAATIFPSWSIKNMAGKPPIR
jgi:hypothetical protein